MAVGSASHAEKVFTLAGASDNRRTAPVSFPNDSWHRCLFDYGLAPDRRIEIPVLSQRELRATREALGERLFLAAEEIDALQAIVGSIGYSVILTDERCITVMEPSRTIENGRTQLTGSIWTERETGTNGVGTCLHDLRPTSVYLDEHFFAHHVDLACACFPLLDPDGKVWGALDLSIRNNGLSPDTHRLATEIGRNAAELINEAVFRAAFRQEIVIKFWPEAGCPGLLAVADGQVIVAANYRMRKALDLPILEHRPVLFGRAFPQGVDLLRRAARTGTVELRDVRGKLHRGTVSAPAEPVRAGKSLTSSAQRPTVAKSNELRRRPMSLDEWAGAEDHLVRSVGIIRKTLALNMPILALGETGVGKDTLARAIHEESDRRTSPFVAVNCGAIPEALIESELFGYVGGAFTGALKEGSAGYFARAHCGTIFLDEIGEMPLALQTRLLRVLESGEVAPLGSQCTEQIDVQIIAATNADLEERVEEGLFRLDLYHRLCGVVIDIPSLRNRSDRRHLIETTFKNALDSDQAISPAALDKLDAWAWPGNFRELKLVAKRTAAIAQGEPVRADMLLLRGSLRRPKGLLGHWDRAASAPLTINTMVVNAERTAIERALDYADGNILKAAGAMGISRATLYRRLTRHGLEKDGRKS
jgi:transcriptional regulator of acetoin/glycerol metabolism